MALAMCKFPHEIGVLNMVEFNSLLAQLGKNVAWDIELSGFSLSGKLDNKFNPLTPDKSNRPVERKKEKPAKGKPKAKQPINSTAAIVNKVNSFIKR